MLQKQAVKHGTQWDQYIHGVVWAYQNIPHSSTGKKPSLSYYLVWTVVLQQKQPSYHPAKPLRTTEISEYREEMVITLSSARALVMNSNQKSQRQYKQQYDKKATTPKFHVVDWVLVYFPQDETGKYQKLSQSWYGPYRIVLHDDPDVTVMKMYFPEGSRYTKVESKCALTYFHQGFTRMATENIDLAVHQRRYKEI